MPCLARPVRPLERHVFLSCGISEGRETRDDNFGIALLSRWPLTDTQIVVLGEADVPSIRADVRPPRRHFTILATHPVPPVGAEYSRLRNGQIEDAAAFLKSIPAPVLLVGDLNVSPWSHHFRRLLGAAHLRDSSRGWGVQPTWPSFNMLLGVPIDHCLTSPEISILGRQVGPAVGSDHYPLIVDFSLPTDAGEKRHE